MIVDDLTSWGPDDTIAVIPARNESMRLPKALAPLIRQGVRVLVVANGCQDGTEVIARACGAAVASAGELEGGVGAARYLGMKIALSVVEEPPLILTTDADSVICEGTLDVLRRSLVQADAAFGRVVPNAREFMKLPKEVRIHGLLEEYHGALLAMLEGASPWNPLPRHSQSSGALMAFKPAIYRAVGGFPLIRCHEDRILADRLARIGARIARPWHATVKVSCRLEGRAPGGMADTIAARVQTDLQAASRALIAECAWLGNELAGCRRTCPTFVPFEDISTIGPQDTLLDGGVENNWQRA